MIPVVFALEIGFGVLGNALYPSAWLPALLGILIGAVLIGNFRSDTRRYTVPHSAAYFATVFLTWTLPAKPLLLGDSRPVLFQVSLGVIAIASLALVGREVIGRHSLNTDRRPLLCLVILYAMGAAVGYLSSSAGGSTPMINWFTHLGLTLDQANGLTHIFRKTVHFSFYGSVGITGAFAARRIDLNVHRSASIGLGIVLLIAGFDELRQSSQPGRTGSAYDVLLDMTGAVVFVTLALWIQGRKKSQVPSVDTQMPLH